MIFLPKAGRPPPQEREGLVSGHALHVGHEHLRLHCQTTSPNVLARFESSSQPGDAVILGSHVRRTSVWAPRKAAVLKPALLNPAHNFVAEVPVVPLATEAGSSTTADSTFFLGRTGQIIGNNDLWIASHCLQLGLTLVTNNEREFKRIPNLPIENWTH